MYYKLEQLHFDLGETSIENIFLNDFMPPADGNFVKVYLLGYKFAKDSSGKKAFSNEIIADVLGIIESDVLRAWQYWEKQGIIRFHDDNGTQTIEFLNLKQLYINNVYTKNPLPKVNHEFDQIVENPKIANLLTRAEFLIRKPISSPQKRDIAKWIEIYNMPADLIEEAFFYSTEVKQIFSIKYVEGIVRNWADRNIRTMEEIEQSYLEHDEKYYRYHKILNQIGFGKKVFTKVDFDLINSWFEEMNFSMDMVMEACKRTSNISKPSLSYVDGVLRKWKQREITTLAEIAEKDQKPRASRGPKTKFHNFRQITQNYSEEELEEVARRKRAEAFEKLGVNHGSISKDC